MDGALETDWEWTAAKGESAKTSAIDVAQCRSRRSFIIPPDSRESLSSKLTDPPMAEKPASHGLCFFDSLDEGTIQA
jgi:hypothetical protein